MHMTLPTRNLHCHALATKGAFDRDGLFQLMPFDKQGDIVVLERLFARRVLDLMVRRKRLSFRLQDEMLSWEHRGFSVDGKTRARCHGWQAPSRKSSPGHKKPRQAHT